MADNKFFNNSQKVFKFVRCWSYRQEENKTRRARFFKWMMIICSGVSLVIVTISDAIDEIRQGQFFLTFVKAAALSVGVCTHKMFAVAYNDEKIYACIKQLELLSNRFKNKSNINESLSLYNKLFVVGMSCINFCSLSFMAAPLLTSEYRPLIYTPHLPYLNVKNTPNWQLLYVYEVVATLVIANIMIAYDTLFCGMMCVCSGIMSSICREIREFEEISKDHQKLENQMKETIQKLNIITGLTTKISNIFSKTSATHIIYNCNTMALGLFMITILPFNDLIFIAMASLTISVTFQLWMYCYFGQNVVNQRDDLRRDLYFTAWYDASKNFKTMLLLTILEAQNDRYFYAGKIIPLSLQTFAEVLKKAYAFFTIMNESR